MLVSADTFAMSDNDTTEDVPRWHLKTRNVLKAQRLAILHVKHRLLGSTK